MNRTVLSVLLTAVLAIACTPENELGNGAAATGGNTVTTVSTGGNTATGGTTTVVSTGGNTGTVKVCDSGVINGICHTPAGALGNNTCNAFGTGYICEQTGCVPTNTNGGCLTVFGATGTLVCDANGANWNCIANAIPTGGNTGTGGATTVTSTGGSTVVTSTGGNSATGGSTTVLDTVSPLVSNVSVGSFAVNVLDGFSVNAWDNVMVVNCDLVLDGTNVGGMLPPSGDKPVLAGNGVWGTTWMFRVPGVHNVAVTCKDAAGNKTTSQSVMFMVANPVISTGGTTCPACNGTGGTTGAAGSSGSGGTTATSSSTSTAPTTFDVCWYEIGKPDVLVCNSRWVPNQPTQADLMVWNSPQGSFIATTTISSDGNYRWSLAGKLVGAYNAWYTCRGCGTAPEKGANYGANVNNIAQVSTTSMKWLTCPSPGYDVRFYLDATRVLLPAGCGSAL